jgi:predicted Zn-dependent peptidase
MQMIDRNIAPEIKDIKQLNIRKPDMVKLSGGAEVFLFDVSDQDFVKVELNFDAGSARCAKTLIAGITNKLLSEGTKTHSAAEIANLIDSYGGFFETSINNDIAVVALYTLNKYLDRTLALLAEIVYEPVFAREELDIYLAQKKNEFLVNRERVNFVARLMFPSLLFGKEHPYGRYAQVSDFDRVQRDDVIRFHKEKYLNAAFRIMVAGKVTEETLPLLEKYFGAVSLPREVDSGISSTISASGSKEHFIEKEGAVQNAIRIGKQLVGRQHPDYAALRIVNTILGGYFGSRLMMNIREDKGYTYGIGSGIVNLRDAAYFYITSEVKAEVTDLAVDEILKEIRKLQTEAVSADELSLVKNYLQGEFQRSFDGPFALLSRFKEIYYSNLDYDYFEQYIQKVKSIDAEEIMHIANNYWSVDELYRLIVGKKQ